MVAGRFEEGLGGGPAEEVFVVAGGGLGRFDASRVVSQAEWNGEC